MALEKYRRKRRFSRTPEPPGAEPTLPSHHTFVVQKHKARRLHYDFRLAFGGVLKSWAVPKGPCLDPAERRLAVQVEDHPIEYVDFEGAIPEQEYGGGTVIVWDRGDWESDEDLGEGLREGSLKFRLRGKKLRGGWALVRMRPRPGETRENWLLIKERDAEARSLEEFDVLRESPESVLSGKTLEQVAASPSHIWSADRGRAEAFQTPSSAPRRSWARRAAKVPKAKKAKIPLRLKPQLATPIDGPPEGPRWFHEIKFDGYRLIATLLDGCVTLRTRNELDWTDRFPELADAVAAMPAKSAMLDGEVVALLPSGASSFQTLQNAFRENRTGQLVYYIFDLLYLDGYDLRSCALEERKRLLAELLRNTGTRLQYADHIEGEGSEFFRQCCHMGLEGCVSKRRDRPYRSGRGPDWVKAKCVLREEFVIGGFTEPAGTRTGIGALLIGSFNGAGELVYHGRVGTGFTEEGLRDLRRRLEDHRQPEMPFVGLARNKVARGTHWVEPLLVAQVEFSNWTGDGLVWHPSFQGLREDVSASSVVRDQSGKPATPRRAKTTGSQSRRAKQNEPAAAPAPQSRLRLSEAQLAQLANVRLTSPNKVLYPDTGITKLALASYYAHVSRWMLPHLVDRPVTILRAPEGEHGHHFYQKHATPGMPAGIGRATIPHKGKPEDYLVVRDLAGLVSLVQLGALEIHPWQARVDRIERPDRIIFDLDPDPSVSWSRVTDAARRLRDLLDDLGLVCFVKTSGGKGLHVVVPILRRHGWDLVKRFSQRVAHRLVKDSPREYTATMAKAARVGRIYIDFHRNHRGATAVAAYSTRARPGAPVSVPLFWKELSPAIGPDHFHVSNLMGRLASLKEDPWAEISRVRQSLSASIRAKLQL